jgi:hypothetical protein
MSDGKARLEASGHTTSRIKRKGGRVAGPSSCRREFDDVVDLVFYPSGGVDIGRSVVGLIASLGMVGRKGDGGSRQAEKDQGHSDPYPRAGLGLVGR